jgi:hypothetical protein
LRVRARTCPGCSKQLDGAHDVNGTPATPRLGDLTVCMYCALPLRFAAGDVFERLTDEQLGALSPDARAGIKAGQKIAADFAEFKTRTARPMPKARA